MPTYDQILIDIRNAADKARLDAIYAYCQTAFAQQPEMLRGIATECSYRVQALASPPPPAPPVVLPPPPSFLQPPAAPVTTMIAPPVPQQLAQSSAPIFDPLTDLQIAMLNFGGAADALGVPGMGQIVSVSRMNVVTPNELWRTADAMLGAVRAHLQTLPR